MTRRMIGTVAAVVFTATAVFAQSKDFSGTWVLDKSKDANAHGPAAIKITMTAKTISLEPVDDKEGSAKALVFNLDGTETDMPMGGKGKAEWKGAKLVTTISGPRGDSMSWSREGDVLVHEMTTPKGLQKTYFKRQAPK
jgi:hypothetical protein